MNKRILVVDDSRFVFEEMKYVLSGTDFEIVGYCKEGETVLDTYTQLLPDVVTMDIILPGIDGLEATRQLLGKFPNARVIIVSSLAYDDTRDEANSLGVSDFIFKPFEKQQVLDALDKATQNLA